MRERPKTPVKAIDGFGEPRDRLRAALDASCVVGTWDWDIVRRTMVYDVGAARLLTGDPSCADTELSGLETIAAVHPDDHGWLIDHAQRAVKAGGLMLAEYRVVARDGRVHWLLSRGPAPDGRPCPGMSARGIIIDITELRADAERHVFNGEAMPVDPLERASDLALALKRILGDDVAGEIRIAADLLLMGLGRAIARGQDPQ
jgi:hypothetical protein